MGAATAADVRQALDRAAGYFGARETRAGVVARRLLGHPGARDEELAEHIVRQRRRMTRMNGSIDGSLVKTAWAAIEFMDLGWAADHAAVVRTVGFLTESQDAPGHFGEGCTEERHARRLCRHYLSGFFSVGSWDEPVGRIEFPSGVTVDGEARARFAASCFALRAVLRAGQDRRAQVRAHVESLLALDRLWNGGEPTFTPDLRFFALGALGQSAIEHREPAAAIAQRVAGAPDPERGWSGAHLFHALDMLLGFAHPVARQVAGRIAPLLCSLQRASGGFGDENAEEEQSLIAVRVLKLAAA